MRIVRMLVPDQHPGIDSRAAQSKMLAIGRPGGTAEMIMRGKMKDFHWVAGGIKNVYPDIAGQILWRETWPKKDALPKSDCVCRKNVKTRPVLFALRD